MSWHSVPRVSHPGCSKQSLAVPALRAPLVGMGTAAALGSQEEAAQASLWSPHSHPMAYLGFSKHDVLDDRWAAGLAILQPHVGDLVATDLAMLLAGDGQFPGDVHSCGVQGLHLHLPWGPTGHWRSGGEGGQAWGHRCWLGQIQYTPRPCTPAPHSLGKALVWYSWTTYPRKEHKGFLWLSQLTAQDQPSGKQELNLESPPSIHCASSHEGPTPGQAWVPLTLALSHLPWRQLHRLLLSSSSTVWATGLGRV